MKVELFIQKKCITEILQVNEINILISNFPHCGFMASFHNQNIQIWSAKRVKGWIWSNIGLVTSICFALLYTSAS